VFEARIVSGVPVPDGDEIAEVRWASSAEADLLELRPSPRHIIERVRAGCTFDR